MDDSATSNSLLFTVTSSDPSISSLSPSGCTVGTSVTVTGSNFGSSQGASTVAFNGTTGAPTSWSATSIKVPVPTGATTGDVVVTVGGVQSNQYAFEVGTAAPNITSISPTSGAVGTAVTLKGTGFGSSQGTSTVAFNQASGAPTSWSATQIKVPVPAGATSGSVVVTSGIENSNSVSFTVPGTGPSITSLSPSSGPVGTSVTITGTNFAPTQGTSTVTFNGVAAIATGWSLTSIVATVPSGAANGSVVVTVAGTASSGFSFAVAPSITSLSPTSGGGGTTITITGTSFGPNQGTSTVTFNGTASTPTSWGASLITVPVPSGATSGNVVVTVGGVTSNGISFTVSPPPQITSLASLLVAVGTDQCISGSGFGSSQGSSAFSVNGIALTTDYWGDTTVCATIPANFVPGTASVQVTTSAGTSNAVSFTVTGQPTITSISPASGPAGTQITITGTNFGSTKLSNSNVLFNDSFPYLAVVNWSNTQIVATITIGTALGQGELQVSNNGLWATSYSGFTVTPPPSFAATTGAMVAARYGQTATQLTTAHVLIVGGMNSSGVTNSTELYSPTSQTFASANALNAARWSHSATLLNDGTVLIVGGLGVSQNALSSAEIYSAGSFTLLPNGLNTARAGHTATLLNNGQVLIVGGYDPNSGIIPTAELYDPPTQTFIQLGNTSVPRSGHTATALQNGQVLITGGETNLTPTAAYNTAEIYNPVTQQFASLSVTMTTPREGHAASLLNSGQVLITGGDVPGTGSLSTAEIYDPVANTFTVVPSAMTSPRILHRSVLLNGGTVLLSGGANDSNGTSVALNTAEIYDPTNQTFTAAAGTMISVRERHTATLLTDGTVLLTGGSDGTNALGSAELYLSSQLAGLSNISIAPANSIPVGAQQLLVATGIFNNGSTETLASVLWSSSSSSVATVSNDSTNPGLLVGVSQGGSTITASATLVGVIGYDNLNVITLAGITMSPQNPLLIAGQTQQFSATGQYSDGSTQDISASATWSSSLPSVATVSGGLALGLSQGLTTIQVSSGSITASTTLNVATGALVSISLSPSNPSVTLNSSQQLTLAATGSFSDGSSQDVSNNVTWSSSNTSVAVVFPIGSAPGVVVPIAAGSTNIAASLGAISGATAVTVIAPPAQATPNIQSASPANGIAGTQVTVAGSGFGASQGTGSIQLGSSVGSVVSWSDSQVVATVNTGSTSGVAQVQQSGNFSNSVPFTVNTPTINGATPTNGLAGTQVTVAGSGFGASQGSGVIWLGNAAGIVSSWSDGQVMATVATGAGSGSVQILQNGVWSNSIPFTVEVPHIQSITPNSGAAGTVVTITGSGFGSSEGSGTVWLGSTYASAIGWSDTLVTATVASNAVSGIAKVQQNGIWSNGATFTVPVALGSGGASAVTLVPNVINMLIGDTRTIQALNSNGVEVTGLSWSSSNTAVATLSTDDPPIITAVGAGNTTITGGSASTDLTVSSGTSFATGTVLWSDPGDGSGVAQIVPAVPSYTGAADVFALQGDCNVQAIASDGTVAWTSNVGMNTNIFGTTSCNNFIPDFQGGLTVVTPIQQGSNSAPTIQKFDGITGQAYPAYTLAAPLGLPPAAVHTDGTIFTIDGDSVVGINPLTGAAIFRIAADDSTGSGGYQSCSQGYLTWNSGVYDVPPLFGQIIIAGDGYAYVPYLYTVSTSSGSTCGGGYNGTTSGHFRMLRVGSDGTSTKISLRDYNSISSIAYDSTPGSPCPVSFTNSVSGRYPLNLNDLGTLITNADQGVALVWLEGPASYVSSECEQPGYNIYYNQSIVNEGAYERVTLISSSGITSDTVLNIAPVQSAPPPAAPLPPQVTPVLQNADGSYVGTFLSPQGGCQQTNMVDFDQSGNVHWIVPSYTPQIATADGGSIATYIQPGPDACLPTIYGGAVTFDQNGNQTGQAGNLVENPTQQTGGQWLGWMANQLGNSYSIGSGAATSLTSASFSYAPTFAALGGGNSSGQGTAIQQVQTNQSQTAQKQLPNLSLPVFCTPGGTLGGLDSIPLPLTPTCGNLNAIELLTSQSPASIFQTYLQTFLPVTAQDSNNTVMSFTTPSGSQNINVTGPGQTVTIKLQGINSVFQGPFSVLSERVDSTNNVISVVTLKGHPLAGWRYWRVYSIGTNDVVIETGGYDQPGPLPWNFAGFYISQRSLSKGWKQFLQYIQTHLNAPQGTSLKGLGGISLAPYSNYSTLLQGYWDYSGSFTNYILNNVCQSTSCN